VPLRLLGLLRTIYLTLRSSCVNWLESRLAELSSSRLCEETIDEDDSRSQRTDYWADDHWADDLQADDYLLPDAEIENSAEMEIQISHRAGRSRGGAGIS
jgi:hypothetical protein